MLSWCHQLGNNLSAFTRCTLRPLQIVCASICGWAYAFMITIQPVRKDYEVLYDYGYSYCK
jgi:hypothetical protein